MKRFSLDEYLKNPSKKVITRDGRNARIICTDAKGTYPIVALIESQDGFTDNAIQYTKDGRYFNRGIDDKDIFFASEKKVGWVNIFEDSVGNSSITDLRIFTSKEDAEKEGKNKKWYVTTAKIEWEE